MTNVCWVKKTPETTVEKWEIGGFFPFAYLFLFHPLKKKQGGKIQLGGLDLHPITR